MKSVTFDSTSKPTDPVVILAAAAVWNAAYATITEREAENTDFIVELKSYSKAPDLVVWD